jgi:energy-coupling factor transporter ATP-binding protein EcfA2
MEGLSGKEHLIRILNDVQTPRIFVTVTQLDTGALETQVNTEMLEQKIQYVLSNYDEDLKLLRNPRIQIKGLIIL